MSRVLGIVAVLSMLSAVKAPAAELKISDVVKSAAISGDLTLRHDNIQRDRGGSDYNRERFRLRAGVGLELPEDFYANFRFASATPYTNGGDQASEFQTEGFVSSQKSIWIDRAYIEWKGWKPAGAEVSLLGGKMANPLWLPYVSNMVWSDNFNPEGYAEKVTYKAGDISLFATLLQMAANNNTNVSNQWMFGQQVGAGVPLAGGEAVKASASYYIWDDADKAALSPTNAQPGNTSSGGVLSSRFGVAEVMAEYTSKLLPLPLSLQGSYIKNLRAQLSTKYDTGYHLGVIYGKAKEAKTWECSYFYKMVQPDATVAAPVDTTFGAGGTNVKGHLFTLAYNVAQGVQFKGRYYLTQPVIGSMSSYGNINRFVLDATLTF